MTHNDSLKKWNFGPIKAQKLNLVKTASCRLTEATCQVTSTAGHLCRLSPSCFPFVNEEKLFLQYFKILYAAEYAYLVLSSLCAPIFNFVVLLSKIDVSSIFEKVKKNGPEKAHAERNFGVD